MGEVCFIADKSADRRVSQRDCGDGGFVGVCGSVVGGLARAGALKDKGQEIVCADFGMRDSEPSAAATLRVAVGDNFGFKRVPINSGEGNAGA